MGQGNPSGQHQAGVIGRGQIFRNAPSRTQASPRLQGAHVNQSTPHVASAACCPPCCPGVGATVASLGTPPGKRTVNTEPLPGLLATVMSPPIMRQKCRLMARPRPVPPYLLAVVEEACENS